MFDVVAGSRPPFERTLYTYYERYGDEQMALIDGDWKLVRRGPPILGPNPADAPPPGHTSLRSEPQPESLRLFNLAKDPQERRDLSRRQAERAQKMLKQLRAFRALREDGGVPPMIAPIPNGWTAPLEWRMAE